MWLSNIQIQVAHMPLVPETKCTLFYLMVRPDMAMAPLYRADSPFVLGPTLRETADEERVAALPRLRCGIEYEAGTVVMDFSVSSEGTGARDVPEAGPGLTVEKGGTLLKFSGLKSRWSTNTNIVPWMLCVRGHFGEEKGPHGERLLLAAHHKRSLAGAIFGALLISRRAIPRL